MNTPRFFLSQSDGHLYRDNAAAPFRKGMAKWNTKIKTVAELKATIRAADYAFGGVSLVLFTADGGTLCEQCARSEFRQIAEAIRDNDRRSGWCVIAASMDNELEACKCDHCGAVIVEDELEEIDVDERDLDDDFADSDPWRGGPEGDMYG